MVSNLKYETLMNENRSFIFCFKKNVTNLDLINGGDGSLDFNGGHHFEGFLDGGRAHFFVAESDSSAQGLTERKNMQIESIFAQFKTK